jgi:saccharopine dehydrogenase-like NADP-dependent oxidoreductase
MKTVLILGAGLVAKPMVKYLLEKGYNVIVASRTLSKAENLIQGHSKGKAIRWIIKEKDVLHKLVEDCDCVVSLLPYTYHVEVAEVCLLYKTDLITTSYVSNEMQNLDKKAIDKGVLLLNEIGLDPGIDHLSAKKTIDYIHRKGGKVIAFHSYCGALPAVENSNNPFRYKIGWSPRGVVLAGRNRGRYLLDGEEVIIPGEELFKHYFKMNFEEIGNMEIYTNRDSIQYINKYDINETNEIFRGTIRYPGWCELWYVISKLGLLNTEEKDLSNLTYLEFVKKLIRSEDDDFSKALADRLGYKTSIEIINKLEWLGLFKDNKIPIEKGSNIDVLVSLLNEKLIYKDGEKDMVILQDEIVSEINGEKDIFISKLVDYGIVGDETAIARTVSLPAACAAHLTIIGEINEKGVFIPTVPDIYEPVLRELLNIGIEIIEKRERAGKKFGLDSKDFVAS